MSAWELVKKDIKSWYRQALIAIVIFAILSMVFHNFCPLVLTVGFPCPACGFTRALILLLQGRILQAFHMHPMIYPTLLFLIYFCWIRYIKQKKAPFAKGIIVVLLLATLVLYGYRMRMYFPKQEPMVYESNNLVRMIQRYKTK